MGISRAVAVLAVAVVGVGVGAGLASAQDRVAARPPKTPDGQPDIQGVWGSAYSGMFSLAYESMQHLQSKGMPRMMGFIQSNSGPSATPPPGKRTIVVDPPDGILPHQPWALERRNSVMRNFDKPAPWQIDSQTRGWPNGVPRSHVYSSVDGSNGGPWQILQGRGYVLFLYETQHEFRYVPLDGRPRPGKDVKLWMGSSRGRWEGNTLVIETTNNLDSNRLNVVGDFHSDEMKVTERFTYVDKDTLDYRATVDDLRVFTRPWTIEVRNTRVPAGAEIFEYAGVEGDKDAGNATADAQKRAALKR